MYLWSKRLLILLQVHLLRVACSSKGPLAEALPQITDELHQLGVSLLHYFQLSVISFQYWFHFVRKISFFFPQLLVNGYSFLKQHQILSEGVLDLAAKPSPDFNRTFEDVFNQNMVRILWHT